MNALRSELSWTHYRLLLRVEMPQVRAFYEAEAASSNWSTRQLERQISSFYYERLLASRDREPVRKEIQALEPGLAPEDIIKDPYVLEFLQLRDNTSFREKELETALLGKLQQFLLELGRAYGMLGGSVPRRCGDEPTICCIMSIMAACFPQTLIGVNLRT